MDDSPRVKAYHRTRRILGVAAFVVDLAVLVILLLSGWTISLREVAEDYSRGPAFALLIYLCFFGIIAIAAGLPMDYITGFWLEHRYGLSNLTLGGWIVDQIKGWLVGGALAALGLECVYALIRGRPHDWWWIAAALFVGFFIVLTNLAPVIIFPIFFKFKPLENSSLVERLLALSRRAGTRVKGVFEWKLSEKSKKANAALVGLGNTRRIILADTLLEKFSDDEVEAVLAHELGHHVRRHIFQGLAVQAAGTFLGFYLLHVTLERFAGKFGFAGPADFANLPLLALVATALSLVLLPAVNAHSRALERQADAYALQTISTKSAFVTAMRKLADLNLAEHQPPAWIEFLFHSHPSIRKRIAFAEQFSTGN